MRSERRNNHQLPETSKCSNLLLLACCSMRKDIHCQEASRPLLQHIFPVNAQKIWKLRNNSIFIPKLDKHEPQDVLEAQ